jgi:formylglycine-generating enzyme required for sulfatase activity
MRFFLLFLFLLATAWANDLRLSDLAQLDPQTLRVSVSWDNSWRFDSSQAPGNYDAVWLFGKYRVAGGSWQPLRFDTTAGQHYNPAGMVEVASVEDGQGVFVQRNAPGTGDISPKGLILFLAEALPANVSDITLMGIEMVWVPQGPFWLGDSSSFHHFRRPGDGGPFRVDGEGAIASSDLSVGSAASLGGDLPAAYPKGYAGFYAMKYELSQAQYRDFLNLLTYEQQAARTAASPGAAIGTYALANPPAPSQRNGLMIAVPGSPGQPAVYACEANPDGIFDQPEDGQTRACSFLNWDDLTAYLDWAGLRPLTELEYEKACRGPVYPVPGGFAWGTAQVVDANTVLDDGLPTETVSEQATATAGLASHGYSGPSGPLRVGFGGSSSSGRLQIGGSYYGVLELSGNLWEQCMGVGVPALNFGGEMGDGHLAADGSADVATWPSANGGMYRGGAHSSGIVGEFRDLAVSDRYYWNLPLNQRRNTTGGRGGRH